MTQESSQVNIPPVRVKASPGIATNSEEITVHIQSLDNFEESVELTLELVTSDREQIVLKSVASMNTATKITVPQDLPPGDYELRAIYQDLILDGTPIEITSAENAKKAKNFFLGLEHQQAALKAVIDAKYEDAFELGRAAEEQFQLAKSADIAARSWDDIASAFLKRGEYRKAAYAFERSEIQFRKAGDPDSATESNYWKNVALSNLKTALSSSESRGLELIAVSGKIDFGIITILEDEFQAVLERFKPEFIVEGNRRYVLSRVETAESKYSQVAIVKSPGIGTGEGQVVARDMIEDLNPTWILVVGIAGAVPSEEFTLGDVVISTRLHDYSVEADLEGRGSNYEIMGAPMHKAAQDLLTYLPAIENSFQGWNEEESIRVPRPSVKITAANLYGDESWKNNVKEKLSRHFGRSSSRHSPLYVTGAIASSNRLVKGTETIQEWQRSARQIRAVEMESAGVYLAARRKDREYPVIAIRGISDIVGFKHDTSWTEYACNSAAAFAYALVRSGEIVHQKPTK
jgi:nucleoside phosphorylase